MRETKRWTLEVEVATAAGEGVEQGDEEKEETTATSEGADWEGDDEYSRHDASFGLGAPLIALTAW
jgi:hypothetical protein